MLNPPNNLNSETETYFMGESRSGAILYVGPVTREQAKEVGLTGTSTGYYLCEIDSENPFSGASILGQFNSIEDAYRFAEIVGLYGTSTKLSDFEDPIDLFKPALDDE